MVLVLVAVPMALRICDRCINNNLVVNCSGRFNFPWYFLYNRFFDFAGDINLNWGHNVALHLDGGRDFNFDGDHNGLHDFDLARLIDLLW